MKFSENRKKKNHWLTHIDTDRQRYRQIDR